MAAHSVPYAATASIAFPEDLMSKTRKAKNMKGFRFFHILAPCPTGWAYRSEKTIEMARLAVESRLFPLYEIENGFYARINREPSGVSVEEYVQA
jgi:pyruvate/2-oxoacid:ferredoxin oxidoreductase beta subunit